MIRKAFVLLIIWLQIYGPAFASVLTVEEASVIGAAADDYYTGNKTKLKVIDGGKVGRTLVTSAELSSTAALSGLTAGAAGIAGIAYYERTGKDPVYAVASALASAADALFVPAYQAFRANFVSPESYPASAAQYVGVDSSVGITMQNMVDYVKQSANESYVALKALINDNTSTDYPTITIINNTIPDGGLILDSASGANYLQPGNGSWISYSSGLADQQWSYFIQTIGSNSPIYQASISGYPAFFGLKESTKQIYLYYIGNYTSAPAYRQIKVYNIPCIITSDPETTPAVEPAIDYDALKNALLNPSPALAEDIKSVVQNAPPQQIMTSSDPSPSSVPAPSPSPITNNQIQNFYTENTTNVYNQYLTNANNGTATQSDIAAAETAAQQENEVKENTKETFSNISSNPFQNSYNPGPFDIPTRFTTFLQTVKSSGLFSFSSAFFNSLPGGGSPLLTINGGQTFGTHTFDFSQSLGGGLAILKSVLLALFSFLSVRAIIMKR